MYIWVHHRQPHQNYESKYITVNSEILDLIVLFFLSTSSLTLSPNSQMNLSCTRGGPGSEGSIDPDETPEERERREKDRRAANNARER